MNRPLPLADRNGSARAPAGGYLDGNGKLSASDSFAEFAGPSLGSLLVGLLGAAQAMAGDDPVLRKGAAWSGTANFFVIMVETLGPVCLIRSVTWLRPPSACSSHSAPPAE